MKRFFILVSMVALVVSGCTKTIIKNEVETPISFSTESGKLTRAIVQDDKYLTSQPFGVFAYGSNDGTNAFMNNVEVSCTASTWKATGTTKYYWPNDPRTTINFYAYSPVCSTANMTQGLAAHQQLNGTVAHTEAAGFSLTDYVHSNMYVDFMVATPVKGATYSNPDADPNTITTEGSEGKVPMVFHHQMTQIIFTVKTNAAYSDINFAVKSITLKDITNSASYAQNYEDNYGEWTHSATGNFVIFPTFKAQGAPNDDAYNHIYKTNPNDEGVGGKKITNETILTTQAVTMIPQTIAQSAQKFEIVYTIDGKGVASEVVTKELFIYADGTPDWIANRKITYNVVIGLNEITFEPSVAVWDATDETQNNKPYGDDFEFAQ